MRHAISLYGFVLSLMLTILEVITPFLTQDTLWLTVAFFAIPVTILVGYVSLIGLDVISE